MSQPETVSVIIPVRDGERYVAEALDSILAQTAPPTEVLVVDDGSNDRTAAVVSGYGHPVRCLRRAREGVGPTLNAGIDHAHGELVAFLDADDLWTPRKLELQLGALSRDPDLDLVFGHVEQFVSPELGAEHGKATAWHAGIATGIVRGTMLTRRATLDRIGSFSDRWSLGEFVDWYARAQDLGLRCEILPEVLLRRRLHRANLTGGAGANYADYPRVLREVLRRRRESAGPKSC
jgi:glycosyltransferase involved in cell wall biosynthesis